MSNLFRNTIHTALLLILMAGCVPLTSEPSKDHSLIQVVRGPQARQPSLKVIHLPRETWIVLSSDQLFKPHSATLKDTSKQTLNRVLSLVKSYQSIHIQAFTDQTLSQNSRWTLTQLQANQVAAYLWTHHISSHRISASGSIRPNRFASNHSTTGSAMNRHIKIVLKSTPH